MNLNNYDIIIVGSGLSGSVMANMIGNHSDKKIIVIDKRNHIGGNCFDYIDNDTNIRINKYGAHLFHTNNEKVWKFVNKYSEWIPYEHKVIGRVDDKLIPIPININTINTLYGTNIESNEEMDNWLDKHTVKNDNPRNSEDVLLSRVGIDLYEKVYKYYTKKQWDKYPSELDINVFNRIKLRYNKDERYFTDKFQALPKDGYTKFIENMLNHANIDVYLDVDFFYIRDQIVSSQVVIYTGPIDRYFESSGYPKLEYRSINFVRETHHVNYYQENSVVNYPTNEENFTRIVEYKHFPNQENIIDNDKTVIFKEYTVDDGDPYYPVPNDRNKDLYEKYKKLSEKEKNIYFLGRLASYKYFNMDQVILNAMDFFDEHQDEFI